MKKVVVGFVAGGAVVGLLPAARRISRKLREHSALMTAQCKQMAAQAGRGGVAVGRKVTAAPRASP